MLYKSGKNLKSGAIVYNEENKEVILFSAYLKLDALKEINSNKNIQEIVVRWEVQDLCMGVSDIELYDYCKKHRITLYRNTRIHLKAIWNNKESVFFGSANITGRGIGEQGNYNYELNGVNHNLTLEDKLYFKSIINSSELVDEELYNKLKLLKDEYDSKKIEYPELKTKPKNDKFLLSQLPMSINPVYLLDGFFDRQLLAELDEECLIQDLSTYRLDTNLDRMKMEEQLKTNFNAHPFIYALKQAIKNNHSSSMRYGGVVNWIQSNTTTVPTPRSWEMKREKIVNILYDWICFFDKKFHWDRPNHSQVIYFEANLNLTNFINGLNRDHARGELAPHQIILIAALNRLYKKYYVREVNISELKELYDLIWKDSQGNFKSTNNNIGMPLKAIMNKGLITIKTKGEINDYRSITELENKITFMTMSNILTRLFETECYETEILSHI